MSETQEDYITEAMEMIGAGYEQPAAIIDPPRKVTALNDKGLMDYRVWGWVKTSAKFRYHIKILRGAKHDIWHYLALGVDENGRCKETIKQICEGTGYSHTEVINTLRELDELGYLSIQKDTKGNIYTPEFVARGDKKPTENAVKKVESTTVYQVESSLSEENADPTFKELKELIQKEIKNMNTNKGIDDIAYDISKLIGSEKNPSAKKVKHIIKEYLSGIDEGGNGSQPDKPKKEGNMNTDIKTIALSRGMTEVEAVFIDRACKAFGFQIMQFDEISITAYRWVIKQEDYGQTIEAFADWARTQDGGKFIGKYRKNGGNIRNDWAQAFDTDNRASLIRRIT